MVAPFELAGYAEFRARLLEWAPVQPRRSLGSTFAIAAGATLSVVSVPVAMSSNSKPLAAAACLVFLAIQGYATRSAWRRKRWTPCSAPQCCPSLAWRAR